MLSDNYARYLQHLILKLLDSSYQKYTVMIKSLISRVKSQKTKTLPSQPQQNLQKLPHYPELIKPTEQFKYIPLGQESVVKCNIHKIRYSVLQYSPNIYNQVLACPISVFNKLTYAKRKVKQIDLRQDDFPHYLAHLKPLLHEELPTFNHLLINVYPAGIGIMPHFDGPQYRSKVVVLSLGGPAVISFSDSYSNSNKIGKLLLQNNSIHIFEADAYEQVLHGIQNFDVQSIFLKLSTDKQGKVSVEGASISNFSQTNLCKSLLLKLQNSKFSAEQNKEIDLSDLLPSGGCLIAIHQNEQFNAKIEIVRSQRISITIRQKFQ